MPESNMPATNITTHDCNALRYKQTDTQIANCNVLGYKPSGISNGAVLELVVHNHPGVMSHITGLFSRRAFNLEAIFVAPLPGGDTSRVLLLVTETPNLVQVEKQLSKLHDVLSLRHRMDLDPEVFQRLALLVS